MITELVLCFTKLGMCKVQDKYRKLSLSISKRMGVVSIGKENNKEESLEEELRVKEIRQVSFHNSFVKCSLGCGSFHL